MYRFTILTAVLLTLLVSSTSAQDAENVEQIGRIYNFWYKAYDVVIIGDLAYVATSYSGMQIVDISDPENLEIVGFWDENKYSVNNLAVDGDFVYVADLSDGLKKEVVPEVIVEMLPYPEILHFL